MIQQVLSIMNTAVSAVASWFGIVLEKTGTGTLYIAMMSVVLTVGLLLAPLLGNAREALGGSSDFAAAAYRRTSSYFHKQHSFGLSVRR